MSSIETSSTAALEDLLRRNAAVLLDVADRSIRRGLDTGKALAPDAGDYAPELRRHWASFVTLCIKGKLRGCTGSAYAHQPLVSDVAENAFAAAFTDSRFQPLAANEAAEMGTEISLLTAPEPMKFSSEADLLAQLVPRRDGLILKAGRRRGLFLPQVWQTLPEAGAFLHQLKVKAGLDPDAWPPDVEVERFEAVKAARDDAGAIPRRWTML